MKSISLFENDVIPIVQEKKKNTHFRISEISDITAWRAEQARKQMALESVRLQLLSAKKEAMFGKDAPQGDGVTWKGKASLSGQSWTDRFKEAQQMRANYMKPELNPSLSDWHYEPVPERKKTLFERFKGWIASIWKAANF